MTSLFRLIVRVCLWLAGYEEQTEDENAQTWADLYGGGN